jgi:hypothetical protein
MSLPAKPDYFWLAIWDDIPAGADPCYVFSHPNDVIWEYRAYDFDEVLVGYDKYPHGEPNEPVFRYSVRLPHDMWFVQDANDGVYWFSVVAVYNGIGASVVVDDMESYCTGFPCDNKIFYTWIDGWLNWSGAELRLGIAPGDPFRGGTQSMVFLYYNDVDWGIGHYSEGGANTPELGVDPNWIALGVERLVLWFYGDANNDASASEQMYVALEDGTGSASYTRVNYGNMNDIKTEQWQQWCIDLQDFANGGVDLSDVQTIYLGFGTRGSPVPGGTGVVYFDDIGLYEQCPDEQTYPWGWTNHEHVYNDDAVAGGYVWGPDDYWHWDELHDQSGQSEDMSFILFTDPNGYTCWDPLECAGQGSGDGDCSGNINLADLFKLKAHFGKSAPWMAPECCSDYNQSGGINLGDLFILKAGFGTDSRATVYDGKKGKSSDLPFLVAGGLGVSWRLFRPRCEILRVKSSYWAHHSACVLRVFLVFFSILPIFWLILLSKYGTYPISQI